MLKIAYLYALLAVIFASFLPSAKLVAQDNWILASDHEGIMIYTRAMPNSKVKAVKVVSNLPATSTQLVAAILDIETCNEWVYHSKKNVLVKTISPLDIIYYSEVDVPWPAENRDYVVHIQVTQNPQNKVISINSPCIPGYVAEKPGIVRINNSVGKWTIVPTGKNQVKAEYTLEVDPMGDIPAWLTNLFATKGPLETFRRLKIHVQKDEYKKARFAQLIN
jgi:hypothetical protein